MLTTSSKPTRPQFCTLNIVSPRRILLNISWKTNWWICKRKFITRRAFHSFLFEQNVLCSFICWCEWISKMQMTATQTKLNFGACLLAIKTCRHDMANNFSSSIFMCFGTSHSRECFDTFVNDNGGICVDLFSIKTFSSTPKSAEWRERVVKCNTKHTFLITRKSKLIISALPKLSVLEFFN